MSKQENLFLAKAKIKAADKEHRRKINFNIDKYNASVPTGKLQFKELEQARMQAKNKKWLAIENLDSLLLEFEKKIQARGAKVIWAEDGKQALHAVERICREKNCTTLVKSKSMVTEEIHLNDFLAHIGIESIETDLGEYIQQLDGEPPYHIVTPAMHKSKEDVARVFSEKLGVAEGLSPEQITRITREKLRDKFTSAQIGVTGANFIVADTGSIAITENEGNARLTSTWPATHIVIAGIEKVIPSLQDLNLFWPLLSTFGTGQRVTVYNTIVSGPRLPEETDGPLEMYVILLDNGRSSMLADVRTRQSLYCIRCGACLNACPVYKNIGGHSYGATYSGPIGKVITPNLDGISEFKHLSYASSLCGNCTEVCPVRIPLHELILHNRHKAVKEGHSSLKERVAWKMWKKASTMRSLMNLAPGQLKSKLVNTIFLSWQQYHTPLQFSDKSFNELWKERTSREV
jgi:L-lactate dehydrogenase complex protein LldF